MEKWLIGLLGIVCTLVLAGCAHSTAGQGMVTESRVRQLEQENATLAARVTALEQENASIAARAATLELAQEELRWLHVHLEKHPTIDPPKSAVEAYLQAFISRNGAAARIYLSEAMRSRLNMPTHGIGTSDWPFRRYEVTSQTEVTKAKYQFIVRICGEESVCSGKPQTFTVENKPGDTGNDAWLITDIEGD